MIPNWALSLHSPVVIPNEKVISAQANINQLQSPNRNGIDVNRFDNQVYHMDRIWLFCLNWELSSKGMFMYSFLVISLKYDVVAVKQGTP